MKRIGCFSNHHTYTCSEKNYDTISHADLNGISKLTRTLPSNFVNSRNKQITVLNFEAFYSDPNNSQNILRSDCTECHSNLGISSNYDNHLICLSGRGFCGYLYYDVSALRPNELTFEFGNPLFPATKPVYIVIQLLLEIF